MISPNNTAMKTICYCITGQTATGKTKYALQLAKEINGEIVNADARQIYKEITILSGKDIDNSPFTLWKKAGNWEIGYHEIEGIKLWLTDITTVIQSFSSFDFSTLAKIVIADIWQRGKIPIIVGGTYLYIHQLLYESTVHQSPNILLREELNKKSVKELQQILQAKYPQIYISLNHSDKYNPHRLIRKIEIGPNATTNFSSFIIDPFFHETSLHLIGFVHKNKTIAIQAIEKRVEDRLKIGAMNEVKTIKKNHTLTQSPGLQTLGYQQLLSVIDGKCSLAEAKALWIQKEIQYAKRQTTFIKKNQSISWNTSP